MVAVSDVYETPPVGGPDQGPYLNCVVRLETLLRPATYLRRLGDGRIRLAANGSNTGDRAP
ncbi:MAG: hypothetical protein Ct9H300mP12_01370 [Acidimicrobiales bacterium]|nr:MAG: hypothetical protein Ct9H300mP12_01370 [Acidimicrobiales bacterium]